MTDASRISGTLTLMTADPLTGAPSLTGHFVSSKGVRMALARWRNELLATESGRAIVESIEHHARELDVAAPQPLSIEWAIDHGVSRLVHSVPQTLAPAAHVRAIVDRVLAGAIDRAAALLAVLPDQLDAAGVAGLAAEPATLIVRGLAASPGVAVGPLAWSPSEIREGCIWVVDDLSAEDAPLLTSVAGVVATAGGLTSDAAIMARALRKPCAVSTPIRTEDHGPADTVSLDGASGELHRGALEIRWTWAHPQAATLLQWAIDAAGEDGAPKEILARARGRQG